MRGAVVLLVTFGLVGCGARTLLDPGAESDDAGTRVDGGRDAGRDAGTDGGRDAGRDGGGQVACASDRDCVQGVCRAQASFTASDLAALPLECGEPSAGRAVGDDCRDRAECDRGLCALAGACVMPCADDSDCAPEDRCQLVYVRTAAAAMQPLQACGARVAVAPDVTVTGPDPGPSIPSFGETEDTLPDLGPNALVVWTAPVDVVPLLQRIRARDAASTVVFDAFARDPAVAPSWGVSPTTIAELATVLYPNGPGTPSVPEGFTVTLGTATATGGDTQRVILRRSTEGSVLDLDLYLVGGGRWSSPDGSVPFPLREGLADARVLLEGIGIALGEVRVHEVVGGLRRRFEVLEGTGTLGVPEELPDLYRLTAGARRPSVHVFFVRTIEGALGIASGIPGPHGLPGTGASGVAIAADVVEPDRMGEVLVHEIGHFVGLFHTSELDGSVNDPFPDTPECLADRDADGDGWLLPDECAGAGADYLMFWAGGWQISPQQAELYRRAYMVR